MNEKRLDTPTRRLTREQIASLRNDWMNGQIGAGYRLISGEEFRALCDMALSSLTASETKPCQTCNDDPAVCATVPGLRHCEAANREQSATHAWAPSGVAQDKDSEYVNLPLDGKRVMAGDVLYLYEGDVLYKYVVPALADRDSTQG